MGEHARSRDVAGGAVDIVSDGLRLAADLAVPNQASAVVVFAHGSGSGRHSPRNHLVAEALFEAGMATVLVDLLTAREDEEDRVTRRWRFDVELLGARVVSVIDWLAGQAPVAGLPVGCFGASTGAAAALIAAAARPQRVTAVVSRGGRPDLAEPVLAQVAAPTLLIVGGDDTEVIRLNQRARSRMATGTQLEIVPGAGHLFEEPGALERVAQLAREWFLESLARSPAG